MNDGKFRLALVKMSNNEVIPDDEPIFILRARDEQAVKTLKFYHEVCRKHDCNDHHLLGIEIAIDRFIQFATDSPERMKEPGITKGV